MKVTLVSYTQGAVELLLFTKATRLRLSPGLMDEIKSWPEDRKAKELAYVAQTIPSSWEFVDYVFLVGGVSRAYTHQQVRTRTGSYAQQAMRVVDVSTCLEYVPTARNQENPAAMAVIGETLVAVQAGYAKLLALGQLVEDARGLLPTNVSTNIVCKFNLRAFADLVRSRIGGRSQDEYQQVVKAMVAEVLRVHPWAEQFLFQFKRDAFKELEDFAEQEYGGDILKKGRLLKIADVLRKNLKK